MKTAIISTFIVCLFLVGCGNRQHTKVNYSEAQGYFVRNDAPSGTVTEKITTQEQFDRYFGPATTMTQRATPIDFSNNFVAAVILPATNVATQVRTDSLVWNGNKLDLYYSIPTGTQMSSSMRPASIIIVNNQYDGRLDATVNDTHDRLPADMHTSRNSLNYAGTYNGTIPCADCPGIDVALVLNSDGTYRKTMTYKDREPNNVFTTQGRYQWNDQGNRITLMGESEPDMYVVEENRMVMLDGDGNRITGQMANMYVLNKI